VISPNFSQPGINPRLLLALITRSKCLQKPVTNKLQSRLACLMDLMVPGMLNGTTFKRENNQDVMIGEEMILIDLAVAQEEEEVVAPEVTEV